MVEQKEHDREQQDFEAEDEALAASTKSRSAEGSAAAIWPQLRKLLVFQVKLYVDALRDLLMSPLSVVVFIVDAVQRNKGDDCLFESLLQFGRQTEKAINLFNQHDINDRNYRGIDSILVQVEDAVKKEYTDGSVSAAAKDAIDKSLQNLRRGLKKSKDAQQ